MAELKADVKVDLKVDQTVVVKDVHLAETKVEQSADGTVPSSVEPMGARLVVWTVSKSAKQ
jgi:hypothetical protein